MRALVVTAESVTPDALSDAAGGVFIGGGIVPRFIDSFARSRFRAAFEAKGRLAPYLARIPTAVIVHPNPAVFGLINLANEILRR